MRPETDSTTGVGNKNMHPIQGGAGMPAPGPRSAVAGSQGAAPRPPAQAMGAEVSWHVVHAPVSLHLLETHSMAEDSTLPRDGYSTSTQAGPDLRSSY